MKTLDTSPILTGVGYPPSKKGFDFLYLSNKEIFSALAQAIGGESNTGTESYALWGCKKTDLGSGNFSFTAGYIYHAPTDEVYFFPLSSMNIATAPILNINTTSGILYPVAYNPSKFSDGTTHNVHVNNQLVLSDGALGSGLINFDDLIRVQLKTAYVAPNFTGSYTARPTSPIKYRRNGKTVTIRGGTYTGGSVASVSADSPVFTLPGPTGSDPGFRPIQDMYFTGVNATTTPSGARSVIIKITTSGVVSVAGNLELADTHDVFMDLSFDID